MSVSAIPCISVAVPHSLCCPPAGRANRANRYLTQRDHRSENAAGRGRFLGEDDFFSGDALFNGGGSEWPRAYASTENSPLFLGERHRRTREGVDDRDPGSERLADDPATLVASDEPSASREREEWDAQGPAILGAVRSRLLVVVSITGEGEEQREGGQRRVP